MGKIWSHMASRGLALGEDRCRHRFAQRTVGSRVGWGRGELGPAGSTDSAESNGADGTYRPLHHGLAEFGLASAIFGLGSANVKVCVSNNSERGSTHFGLGGRPTLSVVFVSVRAERCSQPKESRRRRI